MMIVFIACGSNSNLDVSNERLAEEGVQPSLSLLYNNKRNTYCTATVITPLWALASYSCIMANDRDSSNSNWRLFAGFTNKADNKNSQIRDIQNVIPHPQVRKF